MPNLATHITLSVTSALGTAACAPATRPALERVPPPTGQVRDINDLPTCNGLPPLVIEEDQNELRAHYQKPCATNVYDPDRPDTAQPPFGPDSSGGELSEPYRQFIHNPPIPPCPAPPGG